MNIMPWYQSRTLQAQVVQILSALTLVLGVGSGAFDVTATVAAVFAAIQAGAGLWAAINRLRKASPPITEIAAQRLIEWSRRA